jgi:starch-binding outer membrane protein, SusD/RagB family
MKKYNYNMKNSAVAIILATVGLVSCNKVLDLKPETTLTDAGFWKSQDDLISACNTLYLSLPAIASGYQDNYSDIAFATAGSSISDGSRLTPATSSDWSNNYTLIRRANTILEKAPGVTGDSTTIRQAMGEASFFRAWAYFELMKRFGDVPLILRTFDLNDTLINAHRTPRAQIVKQMYADLDYAASVLPDADQQVAASYGRITSGAALAYKSRIALFEGTREKFFNYGDANADLNVALAAASAVINSGKYALFRYSAKPDSSYAKLFQYEGNGRTNRENILVRLYGKDLTTNIASHNIAGEEDRAIITPTRALLDMYVYKDGLPKEKSAYYKPEASTITEFEDRDPRAGMTIFNKDSWYVTSKYVPNFSFTVTGYKFNKWFNAADRNVVSFIHFAIIRYAEVLLNYAEATYELNENISDGDLTLTVNAIRNRSGNNSVAPLTNALVNASGLDMRTEIRRERTVELAEEGMRYWDLLRWKTAETVLPRAVLGSKYFPAEHGTLSNVNFTPDGYVIVQSADLRSFNVNRDYLWPIPTTELAYNKNLTQNPGW